MSSKGEEKKQATAADRRKEALAAQLRANLQRRKAQARARRTGEADERRGLPVPGDKPADD